MFDSSTISQSSEGRPADVSGKSNLFAQLCSQLIMITMDTGVMKMLLLLMMTTEVIS